MNEAAVLRQIQKRCDLIIQEADGDEKLQSLVRYRLLQLFDELIVSMQLVFDSGE
jgi:hypothetical protein